jgi:hypothetical protein
VQENSNNITYNSFFMNFDKVSMGLSLERGESEMNELPSLGLNKNKSAWNMIDGFNETPMLSS